MIYPKVPIRRLSEVQTSGHLFPGSPPSGVCAPCWWNPPTHQDKTPAHICKMPSWVWNRAVKRPLKGQNPLLGIKSLAKIDQVPHNYYPYSQPEKKKEKSDLDLISGLKICVWRQKSNYKVNQIKGRLLWLRQACYPACSACLSSLVWGKGLKSWDYLHSKATRLYMSMI